MNIAEVRRLALALPATTEEPHFNFTSFRVNGKIFATAPPGAEFLHVSVGEEARDTMLRLAPQVYEKLWWGKKVVGLRVLLEKADTADVSSLLELAWKLKAPAKLLKN
jgi:hypothetical protein